MGMKADLRISIKDYQGNRSHEVIEACSRVFGKGDLGAGAGSLMVDPPPLRSGAARG